MTTEEMRARAAERTTFPVLDTLRAVGALAVLTTHTAFWAGAYTEHGVAGRALARMDVGVAIFFVLSGFLLSRPWFLRAARGAAAPELGRYYVKRLLRIMPVYLVTAVIALALIRENRGHDLLGWLTTLSLTDIYVHPSMPAGLTQMWSLATELSFYLVLPLVMWLAIGRQLRPARVLVTLSVLCIIAVLWHLGLSTQVPGVEHRAVHEWLPAFLIWFSIGIGLGLLQVLHALGRLDRHTVARLEAAASTPGSLWLVAAGLLLVATSPLAGPTLLTAPTEIQSLTKNLLYAGIGGAVVFSGVFTADNRWARAMSHPLPRHLGHISYSLFCIHLPVLHLVMWLTGHDLFAGHLLQIFLLTLVLSLAASEVLYRFVEMPFMRLKDLGRAKRIVDPATTESAPTAMRTK
ncbi:acyltransferase [Nocardioides sp. JQ2195]|uniref:acyltransferase family protein n=1 Tax=Nocardioides sp. JQ2195 TaxID=2592334 RepID=UPI00143EC34E|nr:acyltransferase [Nocardioides sp. JQ2195]QIX26417.1 acyltransferase [Nocardioides sp. JQ2195]